MPSLAVLVALSMRMIIEAGAGLVNVREVTVTENLGIWMLFLYAVEQFQQGFFLLRCTGIGRLSVPV